MKWVTFHWHMIYGVSDVTVHESKEAATKFFKRVYRSYFELAGPFKPVLPCSYGYGHRKFYGMSKRMFDKHFGKKEETA